MKNLETLRFQINALSVFRSILDTPTVSALQKLLYAVENGSLDDQITQIGAFSSALFISADGDLGKFIQNYIENDQNIYLKKNVTGQEISPELHTAAMRDLKILQNISQFSPDDAAAALAENLKVRGLDPAEAKGWLPRWTNSGVNLLSSYQKFISEIPEKGYGIFRKARSFTVQNGEIVPVKFADPQTLDQLYGYERERHLVYENTRALAEGRGAANVLLYGDAGTGKSSTIKACAAAFADQGVRLIEFEKTQLHEIPKIIDQLYNTPLKFIFFIDDLSFTTEDDNFSCLKGMLEGSVTGKSENIAIYASSNRRHLVRELAEDRAGSDIHLNDTLQQTMSLSARFGLTITFQRPEKDLYLEIVKKLAAEENIDMPEDELCRKAEAFAIRSNGRSPRTARQFIQQVSIGLQ